MQVRHGIRPLKVEPNELAIPTLDYLKMDAFPLVIHFDESCGHRADPWTALDDCTDLCDPFGGYAHAD